MDKPSEFVAAYHFMPDGRPAPSALTYDDAAVFLRVRSRNPRRTIERMVALGRLRTVSVGHHNVVPLAECVRLLSVGGFDSPTVRRRRGKGA